MNDIAYVSFHGGGLILSARTPYERQLLVEHLETSTRRYGRVRLKMNHGHWVISVNDGAGRVCAACSQWPSSLGYPAGSTGRLSVVSTCATRCANPSCEVTRAGHA